MIVKMIPETDAERLKYQEKGITEVEHTGVREMLIFGNKTDEDGDLADFHEWNGSHRYLLGSLKYFYEIINDSRRMQGAGAAGGPPRVAAPTPSPMVKHGEIAPDVTPIDLSKMNPYDEEIKASLLDDDERAMLDKMDEKLKEQASKEGDVEAEIEQEEPKGLRILADKGEKQ